MSIGLKKGKMMQIPKRFKLFGQTVEVVFDDNLLDSYDCIGRSSTKFNQIRLQTNIKGVCRPQSDIEQVFIHELIHQCLGRMEEKELRDNEKFVDVLASLIHQALTTAEYEEDNNNCDLDSMTWYAKKLSEIPRQERTNDGTNDSTARE